MIRITFKEPQYVGVSLKKQISLDTDAVTLDCVSNTQVAVIKLINQETIWPKIIELHKIKSIKKIQPNEL